jgi:dihydroorotate dehydrogenase
MYKILRSILFLLPAETAHYFSMNVFKALCSMPFIKKFLSSLFTIHDSRLTKQQFGLTFKNPVGLGAGFDKNARYLNELETMGFGFVEIGTVTPKPQAGNDKPRLFRLPKDKALINRMGFNNDGVEIVVKRLKEWKEKKGSQFGTGNGQLRARQASNVKRENEGSSNSPSTIHHLPMLIGGNIGKNKITPNEEAWKDYEFCFNALHDYVDFFVVNVSSPNTPGLRELQEKDALKKILTHLQTLNANKTKQKPILLKIAPDLTQTQIDDVIELAAQIRLDGLVATNTTISREQLQTPNSTLETIGAGGLSGKPLQKRSTEVLHHIHQQTKGAIPLIGSGGIFTDKDAMEKMTTGVALVEVWTGFIYEGPFIVKNILKSLRTIGS